MGMMGNMEKRIVTAGVWMLMMVCGWAQVPRKVKVKEVLPWRSVNDSVGLFPFTCGKVRMPLSLRGTESLGYMISNESMGFHARFDNPIKVKTVYYPRKKNLQKVRSRSLGMEFGYYSHPSLHRNLYLLGNTQWKYQSKKHWQYSLSAGAGYSRTFLNNPTYRLKDGEFQRVRMAGYNYLAIQLGVTLGYRIKGGSAVYMGYNVLALAPYNQFLIPRKQLQVGFTIPTSFWVGR